MLQPDTDFPDFFELQGRLLPYQLAFVPWFFGSSGFRFLNIGLLWVELGVERKFCVHGTYSILVEGVCLTGLPIQMFSIPDTKLLHFLLYRF